MSDTPWTDADAEIGIYRKYDVRRVNDPTGKHDKCEYYVLDLIHDKYAADALEAYCRGCAKEYPSLALDLFQKAGTVRVRHDYHSPTNGAEINALRNKNATLQRELESLRAGREWIACEDRLPDSDMPVAVTGPTIEGNTAIANFMGDMWLVQSGTPDMGEIEITHWCDCIPALPISDALKQPLPELEG